MNDQKIFEQVAKEPRIGAAAIANNLGLTLATVSADLRMLVDMGDLVKSIHFEEGNGRQWQVYELSEEFKRSHKYKAIANVIAAVSAPESKPAAASTPAEQEFKQAEFLTGHTLVRGQVTAGTVQPTVTVVQETAAPAPRAETGLTKIQMAIACITKVGSASADQLREAMGLHPKASVSPYMKAAREDGRVYRDGDRWMLGAGKEAAPAAFTPKASQDNAPSPSPDTDPIEPAVKSESPLHPDLAAAAEPAPQLRCAVWSDDMIELQRDGEEVARLTQEEFEFISGFMTRRAAT